MSLLADLAIAAMSALGPVTGFVMGMFKATMDDGLPGAVLNVSTAYLPGGFWKDVGFAVGME